MDIPRIIQLINYDSYFQASEYLNEDEYFELSKMSKMAMDEKNRYFQKRKELEDNIRRELKRNPTYLYYCIGIVLFAIAVPYAYDIIEGSKKGFVPSVFTGDESSVDDSFSVYMIKNRERRKDMDAVMYRVKPYKGRYCSRRKANLLNDFFNSLPKPDDEKLKKEADEFRKMILQKRQLDSQTKV